MNLQESRLPLRYRSNSEAMDLGRRLFQERPFLYMALWATFSLPFYALLALLFYRAPAWLSLAIWWFKPVFEAPLLQVMSLQVFEAPPSYRTCVKMSWRLLWRRRLLGDLTIRRFSLQRSLLLPIVVLEGLKGQDFRRRAHEVRRYSGGSSTWLSIFGMHFEWLASYGLLAFVLWLWYGDSQNILAGDPVSTLSSLMNYLQLWMKDVLAGGEMGERFTWGYNVIYGLLLCFWEPIYIACGFTLYLNTRIRSEGWDLRLAAQQMARRLGRKMAGSVYAWLLVLVLCTLGFVLPQPTYAAGTHQQAEVEQVRDEVLAKPPFPHFEEKREFCWRSCQESSSRSASPINLPMDVPKPAAGWVNVLAYALGALLVALALYVVWRLRLVRPMDVHTLPETLFGMTLAPEALPDDIASAVMARFDASPREALSLLYRGSLVAASQYYGLPLRSGDTEGKILARVGKRLPDLLAYWQPLTQLWIALAYAHRLPEKAQVAQLCGQYRQHFARFSGSLNRQKSQAQEATKR